MSYTPVPTVTGGYAWTAADHNTYIRDNFAAGVPDIFTAKGDLAVGSGTNSAVRFAVGTEGQFLAVNTGTAQGLEWRNLITNRQGGSATDWNNVGTNTYTPQKIAIMVGSSQWTGASANNGTLSFSLPAAFLYKPIIIVTPQNSGVNGDVVITASPTAVDAIQIKWRSVTATSYTVVPFSWMCIGAIA